MSPEGTGFGHWESRAAVCLGLCCAEGPDPPGSWKAPETGLTSRGRAFLPRHGRGRAVRASGGRGACLFTPQHPAVSPQGPRLPPGALPSLCSSRPPHAVRRSQEPPLAAATATCLRTSRQRAPSPGHGWRARRAGRLECEVPGPPGPRPLPPTSRDMVGGCGAVWPAPLSHPSSSALCSLPALLVTSSVVPSSAPLFLPSPTSASLTGSLSDIE